MKRSEFRPSNRSSKISDSDREIIRSNKTVPYKVLLPINLSDNYKKEQEAKGFSFYRPSESERLIIQAKSKKDAYTRFRQLKRTKSYTDEFNGLEESRSIKKMGKTPIYTDDRIHKI